jgi:short-subunit dehydrogenase
MIDGRGRRSDSLPAVALPEPSASSAALITGASSGIGEEIARQLAARGHNLILVARREDRLRDLADELSGAHGIRAEAVAVSLDDARGRDELAARVSTLGLDVDVLVNNAGFGGSGEVHRADRARLGAMVALNCEALVDLQARYSGPMAERGQGAIVNIASTASFQPIPGTATYAATKAFVLSFSEGTHSELSGKGVSVTAVCPGPVKTEFTEVAGIGGAEDRLPDFFWTDVERVARDAVEGAAKGRRVVVPGLVNRAGALAGQHTPRALVLPLAKRAWRQAL